ncbi:glycosyltransferase [Thermogemmatispora onikobensis]|uniref:glycosyltransferase n=1 Tax=Thermogemmatispora onikobensis TaxID=732234 RepID=UPI0008534E91|nr:glycosyltransferase [Thermogemmatispora onikobensis]
MASGLLTKESPKLSELQFRNRVARYRRWLEGNASPSATRPNSRELVEYQRAACRPILIHGKEVTVFAPFHPERAALHTFSRAQLVILGGFLLAWGGALVWKGPTPLIVVTTLITLLYVAHLLLQFAIVGTHLLTPAEVGSDEGIDEHLISALNNADWPRYTILCPLYREAAVVGQMVTALRALDYPRDRLEILLLTEEDDLETRAALKQLALPAHFRVLVVPRGYPRTKARACNYGLLHARGDYLVIYDAEDIPDPLQLKKAVLTFAQHDHSLACVQARLNCYNPSQNLLTRLFTAEYSLWFDLVLPGLQRLGLPLPLGGTSNHFRVSVLRAVGGWDAFNVTEDCDLGLRLFQHGFKTVILDSTTYEEANSRLSNWLRQRSRWIKGYMQTYLVYMRHPLAYWHERRWRELCSVQLVIGASAASLLVNPLVWALSLFYVCTAGRYQAFYHLLFPGPILYAGAFCLIFGNFFHLYLNLLALLHRRYYGLVPWALLMPCCWLLDSLAAYLALAELLIRPHYWQKTLHGFHLLKQQQSVNQFSATVVPSTPQRGPSEIEIGLTPIRLGGHAPFKPLRLVLTPDTTIRPLPRIRRSRPHDLGALVTFLCACLSSITACLYFFLHQEILLYGDAYAHLRIARSVFDSATPGLAQLGGVWLPLPHVLMLPFVWNDFLWHSGLAGSFVSMLCYIIAALYLYRGGLRLTRDRWAAFLCSLVFMLNPNILYLQSTPLTELTLICMMTVAGYYFLSWAQENRPRYLVLAAASTFLATLSRYEGWSFFVCLLVLVSLTSLLKRRSFAEICANTLVFALLGGLGIALWLAWNRIIFGDTFFFLHGPFSSEMLLSSFARAGRFYTYHNVSLSLLTYLLLSVKTFGPFLLFLSLLAFVFFLLRHRLKPETLALIAFMAPLGFYVLSIYSGQALILLPEIGPGHDPGRLYNDRHGAAVVVPAALLLATLMSSGLRLLRGRLHLLGRLACAGAICGQACFIAATGIVTLQDGLYGNSCTGTHPVSIYLARHYNGGLILEDVSPTNFDVSEAGINFRNVIYDGSGRLWQQALRNPAASIDWIVLNPRLPGDRVARALPPGSPLLRQFTLVLIDPRSGMHLYHHRGRPPLPDRPIPPELLTAHRLCPND